MEDLASAAVRRRRYSSKRELAYAILADVREVEGDLPWRCGETERLEAAISEATGLEQ